MAATSPTRAPLRRTPEERVLGGVCGGVARATGVDPLLPRLAFVVAATAGGFGVLAYALLWVLLPVAGEDEASAAPGRRPDRASLEIAAGAILLVLAVVLGLRELGWWFSDALVWPTALVAGGAALLWRQAQRAERPPTEPATPAERTRERVEIVSRAGVGVALVIAAALVFLQLTGALEAVRDVALGAIAVAAVLGAIFAPLAVRLVRLLSSERDARIRSQERAEVAAHLHDSVLQTLALVQRRADDPKAVATLARRQERELRAWLFGRTGPSADRLTGALEAVAGEVEADHGVEVDVVAVGDAALDERGRALVAAAREAIVNAAKFGGGGPVSVYAEAGEGGLQVYVRDRGPGFDLAAVPPDRRGVRDSIVGRMERHGGRASIHAAPGAGTEVELVLP
jgi:signal transduction histidine kinase/phage shock protein PspC (stress-responsive transcriptional regulator)